MKSSVSVLVRNFARFAKPGDDLPAFDARFNGAPRQEFPIIVREPDHTGGMFVRAEWGLIPSWIKEPNPKIRPINARGEEIKSKPMFRAAYRSRRALMPIDGFFEWKAIRGSKVKQPYAIAMKDLRPFCVAAIWEEWRLPSEIVAKRTFAIITCAANELVGQIHDRMPVIVAEEDWTRWISEETDPGDLIRPYPSELMTIWPISTRVNSPRNDEPTILDPV